MNQKRTNQERFDEPANKGLATNGFSKRQQRGQRGYGSRLVHSTGSAILYRQGLWGRRYAFCGVSRRREQNRYYLGTKIKSQLRGASYSVPRKQKDAAQKKKGCRRKEQR